MCAAMGGGGGRRPVGVRRAGAEGVHQGGRPQLLCAFVVVVAGEAAQATTPSLAMRVLRVAGSVLETARAAGAKHPLPFEVSFRFLGALGLFSNFCADACMRVVSSRRPALPL